jgi:hypothetical protein
MRARAVALACLLAPGPVLAQLVGDRVEASCASVTRGDLRNSTVSVVCGMPNEQVVELVRLAASPAADDHAALLVRLQALIPANSRFPVEAVAKFLAILHEQPVEDSKLADRFAQIAQEHVRLLEEIRRFRVSDPDVQALREAAVAALQGVPNHDLARAKLQQARDLVHAKREAVARVLADQQREEAALAREQAKVETARLRFTEAARFLEETANLDPVEDHEQRGVDWVDAGLRWNDQGRDFGDNAALANALGAFDAALNELTRDRSPLGWAGTQVYLGNTSNR